jgi:hypothetical protein
MESDADAKYVTPATAASTYLNKTIDADSLYLTPTTAATMFQPIIFADNQWTTVDNSLIRNYYDIPVQVFGEKIYTWQSTINALWSSTFAIQSPSVNSSIKPGTIII